MQCKKCYSENTRPVATTGKEFTIRCMDCGDEWQEPKVHIKPKKSLLKKILRR